MKKVSGLLGALSLTSKYVFVTKMYLDVKSFSIDTNTWKELAADRGVWC